METTLLKRSSDGLWAQIITGGILALLLALASTFVLNFLFGWTPNQGQVFKVLAWFMIVGGWAITSLKQWGSWKGNRYEIGPEAIKVYFKAGMWGSSQVLYRYESIISVRMVQGFWGKRFGFGDVYITIPKLEKDVILRDITDPAKQLADLQARMSERTASTHALIN